MVSRHVFVTLLVAACISCKETQSNSSFVSYYRITAAQDVYASDKKFLKYSSIQFELTSMHRQSNCVATYPVLRNEHIFFGSCHRRPEEVLHLLVSIAPDLKGYVSVATSSADEFEAEFARAQSPIRLN